MSLNPLNQRIVDVMKHFDLDQTKLANVTKVTRQTANGIVLGKAKPGASFLIELVKELKDINVRWLLTGEGQMLSVSNKSEKNLKESNNGLTENKEIYNNLRKDYDNLRNDIEGYKTQIEFLQSLINNDGKGKKAV